MVRHEPEVCTIWANNGLDPSQNWASPRKITDGWHREVGEHIAAGETMAAWDVHGKRTRPFKRIVHLPWGGRPEAMEMDSLQEARELSLKNLADPVAFHGAFMTLAAISPETENCFYVGCPENSPRMMRLFDGKTTRPAFIQAVDAAIRPIIKLAGSGVNVRVFVDGAAMRGKGSPTHVALSHIEHRLRIPIGIEARLQRTAAEWANRPEVDVLCDSQGWYDQEKWPEVVPEDQLEGRQILFIRTPGKEGKAAAETELGAGRSVAVYEFGL